jgi:hypothetical protein
MSRDVDNFLVGIVINNLLVDKFNVGIVINNLLVDKFMVVGSYEHDKVSLFVGC